MLRFGSFFLFALQQFINNLPAKDNLYSRQPQHLLRLYPWQLLGVGSCLPCILQQTQAVVFIAKEQQGFLSFEEFCWFGLAFFFNH